jgi:hypothetical protein
VPIFIQKEAGIAKWPAHLNTFPRRFGPGTSQKTAAGLQRSIVRLPDHQHLIRRMAGENPSWGEERIANELLLKLGLRVSPRTIRKYLPKLPVGPAGKPRGDQRWSTGRFNCR